MQLHRKINSQQQDRCKQNAASRNKIQLPTILLALIGMLPMSRCCVLATTTSLLLILLYQQHGCHHSSLYSTPTFISPQSALQVGASTRQRDSETVISLSRHDGLFYECTLMSRIVVRTKHINLLSQSNMGETTNSTSQQRDNETKLTKSTL